MAGPWTSDSHKMGYNAVMNTTDQPGNGFWKRNLDKIGIGGSIFAALCCLGFPAVLSIVSSIGLGFVINDAILIPVLLVFLAVALLGLYLGMRAHHEPWALALGALSAGAVGLVFLGIVPNLVLAYVGMAGLVVASVLNIWLRARQRRSR